ncbi:hypothetical protein B566_EDAN002413 [Ephemera danica]|nr:hypothetical protein B566_EDAN002413 [Ephemera danica]
MSTAKQYIGSRGIVTVPFKGDKLTVICNRHTEAYVMPNYVKCNVCTDEVLPNIFIPTCVQPTSITVFIIVGIAFASKRCVCFSRKAQVDDEVVYDYAMIDFIQTKDRNREALNSSQNVQECLNKRPMLPIPFTNEDYEEPMDALSETPYKVPFSEENEKQNSNNFLR